MDIVCVFFFKQKTAYEMRISDWSSDVCSSDLLPSLLWSLGWVAPAPPRDFFTPRRRNARSASLAPLFRIPVTQAGPSVEKHTLASSKSETQQIGRASCRERVCQYV